MSWTEEDCQHVWDLVYHSCDTGLDETSALYANGDRIHHGCDDPHMTLIWDHFENFDEPLLIRSFKRIDHGDGTAISKHLHQVGRWPDTLGAFADIEHAELVVEVSKLKKAAEEALAALQAKRKELEDWSE